MKLKLLILVAFFIGFGELLGQEYYVEASRNAIVRSDHDRNSEMVLRLQSGDQLNAVSDQKVNGFYNVFLPNGVSGWVSKYVVRLFHGNAPDLTSVAVMPDVDGSLSNAERSFAEFHLRIGKPQSFREIYREGYVTVYDPIFKIPIWVQYRLTRARSADNSVVRSNDFDEDGFIHREARSTLNDYAGLDGQYVRGHMAPAEDMRWSEVAENESYLLTNIAPQIGSSYNGSVWKSIENRIRGWVMDREDLTIICGPVFEARDRVRQIERQPVTERQVLFNVIGDNNVAVPSAFFKIIIDMRDLQNPNVIAFLVPHIETNPGPERDVNEYLTSIDNIEELTGINFLTSLSEDVQNSIERFPAANLW